MIASSRPGVKPDAEDARIASSDPRIVAFARLCQAIDSPDPAVGIAATRELRQYGLSVCVIRPPGQGGGR